MVLNVLNTIKDVKVKLPRWCHDASCGITNVAIGTIEHYNHSQNCKLLTNTLPVKFYQNLKAN